MANNTTTAPPRWFLFAKGTAGVKAPANLYRYGGEGVERDTLVLAEEAGARPTQIWVARSEGPATWAEEMSPQALERVWGVVLLYKEYLKTKPSRPSREWPTVRSPLYGGTVRGASHEEAEVICPGLTGEINRYNEWACRTSIALQALKNADERSAFDQIVSTI